MQPNARWGAMTPVPLAVEEASDDGARNPVSQVRWTPGPALLPYVPQEFSLEFLCHVIDGMRQWTPLLHRDGFLRHAALAGLAVQQALGRVSSGHVSNNRVMQLLFQLSPTVHERLDYRITSAKDLRIDAADAVHLREIAVDSHHVADDAADFSPRQFLDELCLEGEMAALQANVDNPRSPAVSLPFGIDAVAGRYAEQHPSEPIDLFAATLRLALFGMERTEEPIADDVKALVADRFIAAMEPHLGDSAAEFQEWFVAKRHDIERRIASQKKSGGRIDRPTVRRIVRELIYDSWRYVGQSVSLCMRVVRSSIQPPLTPAEDDIFTTLYNRNPYFGQIPLILLEEHFPMLQPTFAAVLQRPNAPESWVRLRRALEIYARIQLARRATNLKDKKSPRPRIRSGSGFDPSSNHPEDDPASQSQRKESFADVLQQVGACGGCGQSPSLDDVELESHTADGRHVKVTFVCPRCEEESEHLLDLAQARAALKAAGFSGATVGASCDV